MRRKLLPLLLLALSARVWGAYAYKATVTLSPALGGSDLSNYTAAIKLLDPSFKPVAGGGQVQNSGVPWTNAQTAPYDLMVTANSDCSSSSEKWEVEWWDQPNGGVYLHKLFTVYSHTTGPVVYVCVGNPAVTTYQGGAKGAAWVGYTGVYHGGTPTTLSIVDSTSNGNDCTLPGGTANPTATTGQFGGGIAFVAANSQYVTCATQGAYGINGITSTFTMEGWTAQSTGGIIVGGNGGGYDPLLNGSGGYYGWEFSVEAVDNLVVGNPPYNWTSNPTYVAATYNNQASLMYINGAVNGTPGTVGYPFTSSDPIKMGGEPFIYSQWFMGGWSDEIRFSNSARPAGYFATTNANLSNVTAFAVVSNTGPIGGATSVTLTPIII
jgi:hypothetical protein